LRKNYKVKTFQDKNKSILISNGCQSTDRQTFGGELPLTRCICHWYKLCSWCVW